MNAIAGSKVSTEKSSWKDYAACRDADPELFYPETHPETAERSRIAAKTICNRCVVRENCALWAIQTGQDDGIWGGMTATERMENKQEILKLSVQDKQPY